MIRVKKVSSDNFDGFMEPETYKIFRCQMSSGDFHSHIAVDALLPDYAGVWSYDCDTGDLVQSELPF